METPKNKVFITQNPRYLIPTNKILVDYFPPPPETLPVTDAATRTDRIARVLYGLACDNRDFLVRSVGIVSVGRDGSVHTHFVFDDADTRLVDAFVAALSAAAAGTLEPAAPGPVPVPVPVPIPYDDGA